mgnify:FL=1
MKEILESIIKNLVSNPEAVQINEMQGQTAIVYEVKVAEEDMGKVIGRQGRVAQAIRTIVKAIASKEQKRATIEFI